MIPTRQALREFIQRELILSIPEMRERALFHDAYVRGRIAAYTDVMKKLEDKFDLRERD